MVDQSKILERVRKLFAMTGEQGATEAEALQAMNRAQNLMREYHLTEDDLRHEPAVDYRAIDQAEMERFRSFVGGNVYAWESALANFVSRFVGVPCYLDKNKQLARKNGIALYTPAGKTWVGKSIVFYGIAEDAAIARELYDLLHLLIATMGMIKFGTSYKGDGAGYAEGFVIGLNTKLHTVKHIEQQNATSSTALVLIARRDDLIKYKQTAALAWLASEHDVKISKGYRRKGATGDAAADARAEGKTDGENVEVNANRSKKLN